MSSAFSWTELRVNLWRFEHGGSEGCFCGTPSMLSSDMHFLLVTGFHFQLFRALQLQAWGLLHTTLFIRDVFRRHGLAADHPHQESSAASWFDDSTETWVRRKSKHCDKLQGKGCPAVMAGGSSTKSLTDTCEISFSLCLSSPNTSLVKNGRIPRWEEKFWNVILSKVIRKLRIILEDKGGWGGGQRSVKLLGSENLSMHHVYDGAIRQEGAMVHRGSAVLTTGVGEDQCNDILTALAVKWLPTQLKMDFFNVC